MPRKKKKSSETKLVKVRRRVAAACRLIATGHSPGLVEAQLMKMFNCSASTAQKDMRDARETLKADAAREQEDLKAECFAVLDESVRQGFSMVTNLHTGTDTIAGEEHTTENRLYREVSKPDLSAVVAATRLKAQLGGILVERHKIEEAEGTPEEAERQADELRKRRENAKRRAQDQRGGNKGQPGAGKA